VDYLTSTGNVKAEILAIFNMPEQSAVSRSDESFVSSLGHYHSGVFAGVNVSENLLNSLRNEQALRPTNTLHMLTAVGMLTYLFQKKSGLQLLGQHSQVETQNASAFLSDILRLPERMFETEVSQYNESDTKEVITKSLEILGITGQWETAIQRIYMSTTAEDSYHIATQFEGVCWSILHAQSRPKTHAANSRIPLVLEYDALDVIPTSNTVPVNVPFLFYTTGRPPSIIMAPKFSSNAIKSVRVHEMDRERADEVFSTLHTASRWENGRWSIRLHDSLDMVPVLPLDESVPTIDHCMNRYGDEVQQLTFVLEALKAGDMSFIMTDDDNRRLHTLMHYADSIGKALTMKDKIAIKRSLLTR
jgi:hypothetical protein